MKTGKMRGLSDKQLLVILREHEVTINRLVSVVNQIGPKVEAMTDLFNRIAPATLEGETIP